MQMDALGWAVTAFAILLTGISKAGLGGALGGLAVPFMSMWIPPRDAVAVVLPILIVMDMVGIRVWRGKADRGDLRAEALGLQVGLVAKRVLLAAESTKRDAVGIRCRSRRNDHSRRYPAEHHRRWCSESGWPAPVRLL